MTGHEEHIIGGILKHIHRASLRWVFSGIKIRPVDAVKRISADGDYIYII